MSKVKTYIEFIDQSVEQTKEFLEKNELLHYMIGDTPGVDGDKAERDGLSHSQAYELSVYSTMLEMQDRLHKLKKSGSVEPFGLGAEDTNEINLEELLGLKKKTSVKATIVKRSIDNTTSLLNADDKKELKEALKDIIKELEENE